MSIRRLSLAAITILFVATGAFAHLRREHNFIALHGAAVPVPTTICCPPPPCPPACGAKVPKK